MTLFATRNDRARFPAKAKYDFNARDRIWIDAEPRQPAQNHMSRKRDILYGIVVLCVGRIQHKRVHEHKYNTYFLYLTAFSTIPWWGFNSLLNQGGNIILSKFYVY